MTPQNFSYRVIFENNNLKATHAVYLPDWKEGLKLRDFSIVANAIQKGLINVKKLSNWWKVGHSIKVCKK